MSQALSNPRRDTRLPIEFADVRKMLASNPNRLFDVHCASLTPETMFLLHDHTIKLDHVVNELATFLPVEDFARRYPGKAPEQYAIMYHCNTLIKGADDEEPIVGTNTIVEVVFDMEWPMEPPWLILIRNLSWGAKEIWHPNIRGTSICLVDGRPFAPSRTLTEIITVIGRLLQFQSYNLDNPLNGPATDWAEKHEDIFPVDDRDLMDSTRRLNKQPTPAAELASLVTILPD
jgi:ubiquitin-protein ligase